MKYNMMFKMMGSVLNSMVKDEIGGKETGKKVKKTYREIVLRAEDIGGKNRLLSSYGLAAFFIAMNREDKLSPEENIEILEKKMRDSSVIRTFMGSSKGYFSEKNMESRRQWSVETHKKKYKNDWVVDVIEKNGDYEFGFDYTECGVCKLCRDEKCPELAKYLCRLDYMLVDIMGIHLDRTMTLAEGGDKCDFRFKKI